MKVVHLSTYDLYGGAAKAAYRLHGALQNSGVESAMLVRRRDSSDAAVVVPDGFGRKLWSRVQRRCDRLPLLFKGTEAKGFSPGWVPDGLERQLRALQPDIVHLHWVADGFFRVDSLGKIAVPVVWTMHDMWPFTGGCHYAGSCGNFAAQCGQCPQLGSREPMDLSRSGWTRRQRAMTEKSVTFVSPSQWLAESARQSSLLRHADLKVIANGIDTKVFLPRDRGEARARWHLPLDKLLVLAGSAQLRDNPRKGFPDFLHSLRIIRALPGSPVIEVVLFGGDAPRGTELEGFKVHYLGVIPGEEAMASVYAASDIFVAPSLQDNLPNTVVEAMAAGTPVVAYAAGGIPEIVDDGVNGLLAPVGQSERLASALNRMATDTSFRISCGQRAREKALRAFALDESARAYGELYRQLLGQT